MAGTPVERSLKIEGRVMSTPVAATITVNNVELYSGQIGVGEAIDAPIDLVTLNYNGAMQDETFPVSITVTSGVGKFGRVLCDTNDSSDPWQLPADTLDGRNQILINGLPPEWPATPVEPMPMGTPEDPNWSGWCFEVSAGETITFDYNAVGWRQA